MAGDRCVALVGPPAAGLSDLLLTLLPAVMPLVCVAIVLAWKAAPKWTVTPEISRTMSKEIFLYVLCIGCLGQR